MLNGGIIPLSTRCIACIVTVFLMTGCAADELMIKRQAEAEAKIEYLLQSGKSGDLRLNEISSIIQGLEGKGSEAAAQVRQIQTIVQDMRIAQEDLKARLSLLTQQAATHKIEMVNPESHAKSRDTGPPAEYVKAFGLYSANNFNAAIEAFDLFIKKNPQNDYTSNALYWIGECHYSQADFVKAQITFQKILDGYPKSAKFPDALLKLGYSLSAIKEKEKAVAVFERLIKAYPGNPAAAKAREPVSYTHLTLPTKRIV